MSESEIQVGAFVQDNRPRTGKPVVGKVLKRNGDDAKVVFWDSRVDSILLRFLTPLRTDSPEALLWNNPQMLAPWVDEAPLKLIATALSIDGNIGKAADIREKLSGWVSNIEWEGWWNKARPQIRKKREHFEVTRDGKDTVYRLLTSAEAIPVAAKSKSARVGEEEEDSSAEWIDWLEADTHRPVPERYPTKEVAESLAMWRADGIEIALRRLIAGADEVQAKRKVSSQAARGWLRAISQACLRWRETSPQDTRGYFAAEVGRSLTRLALRARRDGVLDILPRAGDLDSNSDAWGQGFLAGMWGAFSGDDAHDFYVKFAADIGRQARGDLAKKIFLAGFNPEFSGHRHSELDRLLDALPEGDRVHLLEEAMARASAGQRSEVLDYIANSRHAVGSERLALRIAAVLMLSDGRGDFAARTSRELADAFAALDECGPEIQTILKDTLARIAEERAHIVSEMEEQRKAHEAELERERRAKERFRTQARELGAEIDALQDKLREAQQSTSLTTGI